MPLPVAVEQLVYRLTPALVQSLTHIHNRAGVMAGARLTHDRVMRLQSEASARRIHSLVGYFRRNVTRDEVAHVVRGDVLAPYGEGAVRDIRHVVLLDCAVRHFGERGEGSTPAICAAYLDLMCGKDAEAGAHWARFAGQDRGRALEAHVHAVQAPELVRRLYERIARDELLPHEPVLRAALLHWVLSVTYGGSERARAAIESLVHHELRAGGVDPLGILALRTDQLADEWLHPAFAALLRVGPDGDVTKVLERFANNYALSLIHMVECVNRVRDTEERLARIATRPPDDLDRQIFDAVERLGSGTSAQILELLRGPIPPLRTLQRRLQHLAADGLVVKQGARRDAFYQIASQA